MLICGKWLFYISDNYNTEDKSILLPNTSLFWFLQPGSRRAVNGTDGKFSNKDSKPATLDPLSCISKRFMFWIFLIFFGGFSLGAQLEHAKIRTCLN